jgi:hypothetical protein
VLAVAVAPAIKPLAVHGRERDPHRGLPRELPIVHGAAELDRRAPVSYAARMAAAKAAMRGTVPAGRPRPPLAPICLR